MQRVCVGSIESLGISKNDRGVGEGGHEITIETILIHFYLLQFRRLKSREAMGGAKRRGEQWLGVCCEPCTLLHTHIWAPIQPPSESEVGTCPFSR